MRTRMILFKQKGNSSCGPTTLRMILSHLGSKISQEDLEKLMGYKENKATPTIKMALAAKKLGYNVELKTLHALPKKEIFDMPYYKENMDENIEKVTQLVEEAKKEGVKISQESVELKKLMTLVNQGIFPIVLLNWNVIKRQDGFLGHFVVLTDFDNHFVYVNNSSGKNGMRNQAISRTLFNEARKSIGTDEDILLIKQA